MKTPIYFPMNPNTNSRPFDVNSPIDTQPIALPLKRKADKLSANVVVLAEMILVETRFITQQTATQASMEMPYTLDATNFKINHDRDNTTVTIPTPPPMLTVPKKIEPIVLPTLQSARTFADAAVNTHKKTVEASVLTDPPIPTRNRSIQTAPVQNQSAATQCDLENEYENGDLIDDFVVIKETDKKQQFQKFVKEKMMLYSNGKRECQICGEITSYEKTSLSHMALHWGPRALCCGCGIQFEHETLLQKHKCETGRSKNLIKCPHFQCRTTLISLHELYDHINEHTKEKYYKCGGCKSTFETAGELRLHITLRLKCLESSKRQRFPYNRWQSNADAKYRMRVHIVYALKRKRVVVKTFLAKRSVGRFCHICQRRCSNNFKYRQHTQRCLKNYLRRLSKKRYVKLN